jgi:hypothetical protein
MARSEDDLGSGQRRTKSSSRSPGKDVSGKSTLSTRLTSKESLRREKNIPSGKMEDMYSEAKDLGGCLGKCMRQCDESCPEGHTGDDCKRGCGETCARNCEVVEAGRAAAHMAEEDIGSSEDSFGTDFESTKGMVEAKDRPLAPNVEDDSGSSAADILPVQGGRQMDMECFDRCMPKCSSSCQRKSRFFFPTGF